ncbi:DUF5682 family protein [Paenibacillus methanolicus]|uniref:Uncharacterized protein n=1 Tax=Paenibacillus methanolicus TaxID=582686 RepID=A0A5S5BS28_9BACL|nr:hypothetical protein BCM02_11968 [Paenibacillus methanolicus]
MSASSAEGRVHVFGVRHLSPAGAHHLRRFLEAVKPAVVLVEGPADASDWIGQLTRSGVVPPIALMAYTENLPVRTLLYPFASYSPEYEAFRWAAANGASAAFIDLPSDISIPLYDYRKAARREADEAESLARAETQESAGAGAGEEASGDSSGNEASDADGRDDASAGRTETSRRDFYVKQHELYERIASLAGEDDYESYWERHFEHDERTDGYRLEIEELSRQMRGLLEHDERLADPVESAVNEVRESYMRLEIARRLESGVPPERIVVVAGAHHVSGLTADLPPMAEAQLAALPRTATKRTLMPYSYYKLSSHSGYGAGNPAPAYFELLWACLQDGGLARLPSIYLTRVAQRLREQGTYRSTASVIEGVRLASALASMRGSAQPILRDLRDAAVVTLGYGERAVVAEAMARAEIGTDIGYLPEGISQTPIQDDMNRNLKRLKLDKYKRAEASELELDLRENRRVKSEEAAFIDLNRSTFLHRLALLGISFAKKKTLRAGAGSWAEQWVLQWSPEAEIELIESTLKGETIEWAAAYTIRERLADCADIGEASRLIRISSDCGLPACMEEARAALQRLSVDGQQFVPLADAAFELSGLIRYGSIRKTDIAPLMPLLSQLFFRAAIGLIDASACSDDAAKGMLAGINGMHTVSQDQYDAVDDELWKRQLRELAFRDDRNPTLSGFAFAIMLERHTVSEEECEREVARRLSPGIPADLGAGWFEGMSMRNRYALLSRPSLWGQLDDYLGSLEQEQFKRSLVFLRRAFSSFDAREKAAVAELLGDWWGSDAQRDAEALQQPLSDEELAAIAALDEFDFSDF